MGPSGFLRFEKELEVAELGDKDTPNIVHHSHRRDHSCAVRQGIIFELEHDR